MEYEYKTEQVLPNQKENYLLVVETLLNQYSAQGWEYVNNAVFRNDVMLLVFRRNHTK